jgi:hypothetical protein
MCNEAIIQQILLYDLVEERAWLVPKLSVLLHMAHAWAQKFDPQVQLPFAVAEADGGKAAWETIQQNARFDLSIHHGAEAFTLEDLITGLWERLEATRRASNEGWTLRKKLQCVDFMDVVNGGPLYVLSIDRPRGNWIHLIDVVDTILVSANIRDVILPQDSSNLSEDSSKVPKYKDYFAATILSLQCLSRNEKCEPLTKNLL